MHRFQKWRDALNASLDEKSVIAVMREYAAVIDPAARALMPVECQEALDGKMDLQSAAVTLLHSELAFRGDKQIGELLHEVAQTFAAASIRLSRLRTEPILPAPK